jgi:hypothetical protein
LTIGAVSDTIGVSATARTDAEYLPELGTVIAEKPIKDLPLNGRNFTQLLTLAPGVNAVETTQGAGSTTCTLCQVAIPGSSFSRPSVNGQWSRSNMFLLDGIVNSHFLSSGYAVLPIVDASQEFKVQSHNDKAQYGGVLGGVVNVVSKSGTNQLHGSGWSTCGTTFFDARDPFYDGRTNLAGTLPAEHVRRYSRRTGVHSEGLRRAQPHVLLFRLRGMAL